jgi:hypothetical protein
MAQRLIAGEDLLANQVAIIGPDGRLYPEPPREAIFVVGENIKRGEEAEAFRFGPGDQMLRKAPKPSDKLARFEASWDALERQIAPWSSAMRAKLAQLRAEAHRELAAQVGDES